MSDGVVLVTGIAGEIGGYLGNQLRREGRTVCGLDQRPPSSVEFDDRTFQQCDLTDAQDTEKKIQLFHEEFGAFDAVINCAAQIANSPLISFINGQLEHHSFELWDQVILSSLSSAFYVTACTVPKMVTAGKKGVIINISSICARGNPGQSAYSAAKAGLNGFTMSLAKELGPMGIRAVAIAPGYFETSSTRNNVSEAKLKEIKFAVPLRRLGRIEEVWSAVEFILNNSYITGTVIEIDGGLVL